METVETAVGFKTSSGTLVGHACSHAPSKRRRCIVTLANTVTLNLGVNMLTRLVLIRGEARCRMTA
jgi:hypothetical protein